MRKLLAFLVLSAFTLLADNYNLTIELPGTRPVFGNVHGTLFIEKGTGSPIICRLRKLTEQEAAYLQKQFKEWTELARVTEISDLGKIYICTWDELSTENGMLRRRGKAYLVYSNGYKVGSFNWQSLNFDEAKMPQEDRRLINRLLQREEKLLSPAPNIK